jgi:two-component system response regulator RegX3
VDRQILMQQVWGSVVPATVHRLEMHIHRLRQKIERDPRRPDLLVTLSGGYQLGEAPN